MATNNAINNMVAGIGTQVSDYTVGTIIANKGDLIVGNGTNSATTLPVGTDTYCLIADSAESTGMKWNSSKPAVVQVSRAFGYGNPLTNFVFPLNVLNGSSSSVLTADTLYCLPFSVTISTTFSKIGMKVSVTTATTIRIGIYDSTGPGGYPGSLVLDAGTMSGVTTGDITISISQVLQGNYWIVYISSGAPNLFSTIADTAVSSGASVGWASPSAVNLITLQEASVGSYFTAMPASLASDTFTFNNSTQRPFVYLQV